MGTKKPLANPKTAASTGDRRMQSEGNPIIRKASRATHVWLRARLTTINCPITKKL